MVRLQLETAARPGEICKLTPGDVDRSGDVWEYTVPGHKMIHKGKRRVICLSRQAQSILLPYLVRAAGSPCFPRPKRCSKCVTFVESGG